MADLAGIGRVLIAVGSIVVVAGLFLVAASRVPGLDRLGRLPGHVVINRGPVTFVFPLVSSLIVSVVLTLILNLLLRR